MIPPTPLCRAPHNGVSINMLSIILGSFLKILLYQLSYLSSQIGKAEYLFENKKFFSVQNLFLNKTFKNNVYLCDVESNITN